MQSVRYLGCGGERGEQERGTAEGRWCLVAVQVNSGQLDRSMSWWGHVLGTFLSVIFAFFFAADAGSLSPALNCCSYQSFDSPEWTR